MIKYERLAASILAAVVLMAPGASQAVAQAEQQQASPTANDFSEQQVASFAQAYVEIRQIQQAYEEPLGSAESESARQDILEQSEEEMTEIIDGMTALSADDYRDIFAAIQNDAEFAAAIQAEMNSLAQDGE